MQFMEVFSDSEEQFTLVDGVIRKTGVATNAEGSLVITEESITFVAPIAGDESRKGGAGPTVLGMLWSVLLLIPPFSIAAGFLAPRSRADRDIEILKGAKAVGCAFVLLSAFIIFAIVFLLVEGQANIIPIVLIFGILPLVLLFIKLMQSRKPKWKKQQLEAQANHINCQDRDRTIGCAFTQEEG